MKIWFRTGGALPWPDCIIEDEVFEGLQDDGDLKLHGDFDTITVGRTLDCRYRMYSGSRMIKVKRRTSFTVWHYLTRT